MLTVRSTINIASQTVPPIIPVVQGDTGRAILFTLADFTIPAGATATYYVQKPSGEAVYNNATIDGNNVLVELTAQSIIEKGDNYGQVRITVGEEVVTSFDFILLVKEFRGIDAVQSLTEMNIFDKAVEQASEAIDEVKTDALEAIDDAKDEAIEEVTSNFDLKLDASSTKGVQNQVITQAINTVNNAIGDLSGETVTPTATNNYGVGGNVGQVIETWATTEYWHGIYTVSAGNTYGITTVSDFPQQIVVWFTNSSNVILEIHKAFATDHVEMVCTAPTGATKLFVMSYGYDAYHGTVQKVEPLSETVSNLKEDFHENRDLIVDILDGTSLINTTIYFKLVQGDLAAGQLVSSENTVTTKDYIDNSSANNFTLRYDSDTFNINIVRYNSQKTYAGQTGFINIQPIRIRQYITDPYVKVSLRRKDAANITPFDTALYTTVEKDNNVAYKDEIEKVTEINVNTNGGADYTTIRSAINSVTNPSIKNRYVINIYPGTYDLKQEYSDVWTDDAFIGCTVPAFTKLKGIGARGSVILTATDTESSESHRLTMSTINLKQSSELENLTITGGGLKYTVHDDYNSDKYSGFREIRDVIVTGDNPLTNAIWGAGAWQNTKTRFVNCVFSSNTKVASVYIHTSTSADYPSYFEFVNCRFKSYNLGFGDCRLNLSSVSNAKNTPCYVTFYGTKVRTIYLTAEGGNTSLNWFVSGFGNEVHGVETTISGAEPQADLIGTATYARYSDGAY